MEEWKDVKGFEGLYQISNLGNCRSLDRTKTYKSRWGTTYDRILKGKMLAKSEHSNEYLFYTLTKDNIKHRCSIHQLVAIAFIPNPNGYTEINHKDGNRKNNNVNNLEWCSRGYNNTYNDRHKKIGEKLHNRKDLSKKVYKYDGDKLIDIYPSLSEAARQNNTWVSNIIYACNHQNVKCKGYRWSYKPL